MSDWAENLNLELYTDLAEQKSDSGSDTGADIALPSGLISLDWDNESFSWETLGLNTDLFEGALPLSVVNSSDQPEDVPSPGASSDVSIPASKAQCPQWELMTKYGLTDEKLSDMTMKQLKKLCARDEEDFGALKSYRRTCLNRNYARCSRSKQQEKAHNLSDQLRAAEEEVRQLKKECAEKDMRIQYLELENRLLMGFNKAT